MGHAASRACGTVHPSKPRFLLGQEADLAARHRRQPVLRDPQLHDAERVEHGYERRELFFEIGAERISETGIEEWALVRRGPQCRQQLPCAGLSVGVSRATLQPYAGPVTVNVDLVECAPTAL